MSEPISDERLRELRELAWNPEYEPPVEEKALRYRHELLRDAVREIERVRGRTAGFQQVRALFEILGEHRIMYPLPPRGETPKLITDLMEWAFVAAACEVQDVTAERDEARAYADALTGAVKSASDFTDAMQRIRDAQGESAANVAAIARAVAALGAGRTDAAELPQQDPQLPQ